MYPFPERQRQQFGVGHVTIVRRELPNNPSEGERLVNGVRQVEGQSQLEQKQAWVSAMLNVTEKPNTKAAYGPKQMEFLEFCDEVYANTETVRHINADKVYRFLFYVTHRMKKKRGRRKKGQPAGRLFDMKQYHSVWNTRRGVVVSPDNSTIPPHAQFADLPNDAPQWDVFNQYKCAIKRLHEQNKKNGTTSLVWGTDIITPWLKDLETIVKQRRVILKRIYHKEKMEVGFSLFNSQGKDKLIEDEMWKGGFADNLRNAFPSIR